VNAVIAEFVRLSRTKRRQRDDLASSRGLLLLVGMGMAWRARPTDEDAICVLYRSRSCMDGNKVWRCVEGSRTG
jgi:hypothetical protein